MKFEYNFLSQVTILNSFVLVPITGWTFALVKTVRLVQCPRNSMWTSLWSSAISKSWSSNLHWYVLHLLNLHSSVPILALLGKATSIRRSRSSDFARSWEIHCLADSWALCLCISSTTCEIFPGTKLSNSHGHFLLHHSLLPHTTLLVHGV